MSKKVDSIHKKITQDLLERMGFKVDIEETIVHESPWVNIITQDSSLLIGRGGENLKSLQHIIKLLIYKKSESNEPVRFIIDVGGYRQKQLERLKWFASSMIEKVVMSGRPEVLRPMNAYERKIIHTELSNHPNIVTESIGEEPNRRIMIKIKK